MMNKVFCLLGWHYYGATFFIDTWNSGWSCMRCGKEKRELG